MQENITITAATITDDMFCHYGYSKLVTDGITDKYNVKSQLPIHEDMKTAFRKFNAHLAVICEEVADIEIDDIEAISLICPKETPLDEYEKSLKGIEKKLYAFIVSGIRFDGTGENEGISLIGKKKLSTGEWLQLTTPKITWESSYYFINELRTAADDLAEEVNQYMCGKQAPRIIQTEMEFPEEQQEGEESKPKKRGRKGSKENPVIIELK